MAIGIKLVVTDKTTNITVERYISEYSLDKGVNLNDIAIEMLVKMKELQGEKT